MYNLMQLTGGMPGNVDDTAGCESKYASLSACCVEVHSYSSAQKGKAFCLFDGVLFT